VTMMLETQPGENGPPIVGLPAEAAAIVQAYQRVSKAPSTGRAYPNLPIANELRSQNSSTKVPCEGGNLFLEQPKSLTII
jgi:hypothetical protein